MSIPSLCGLHVRSMQADLCLLLPTSIAATGILVLSWDCVLLTPSLLRNPHLDATGISESNPSPCILSPVAREHAPVCTQFVVLTSRHALSVGASRHWLWVGASRHGLWVGALVGALPCLVGLATGLGVGAGVAGCF